MTQLDVKNSGSMPLREPDFTKTRDSSFHTTEPMKKHRYVFNEFFFNYPRPNPSLAKEYKKQSGGWWKHRTVSTEDLFLKENLSETKGKKFSPVVFSYDQMSVKKGFWIFSKILTFPLWKAQQYSIDDGKILSKQIPADHFDKICISNHHEEANLDPQKESFDVEIDDSEYSPQIKEDIEVKTKEEWDELSNEKSLAESMEHSSKDSLLLKPFVSRDKVTVEGLPKVKDQTGKAEDPFKDDPFQSFKELGEAKYPLYLTQNQMEKLNMGLDPANQVPSGSKKVFAKGMKLLGLFTKNGKMIRYLSERESTSNTVKEEIHKSSYRLAEMGTVENISEAVKGRKGNLYSLTLSQKSAITGVRTVVNEIRFSPDPEDIPDQKIQKVKYFDEKAHPELYYDTITSTLSKCLDPSYPLLGKERTTRMLLVRVIAKIFYDIIIWPLSFLALSSTPFFRRKEPFYYLKDHHILLRRELDTALNRKNTQVLDHFYDDFNDVLEFHSETAHEKKLQLEKSIHENEKDISHLQDELFQNDPKYFIDGLPLLEGLKKVIAKEVENKEGVKEVVSEKSEEFLSLDQLTMSQKQRVVNWARWKLIEEIKNLSTPDHPIPTNDQIIEMAYPRYVEALKKLEKEFDNLSDKELTMTHLIHSQIKRDTLNKEINSELMLNSKKRGWLNTKPIIYVAEGKRELIRIQKKYYQSLAERLGLIKLSEEEKKARKKRR